MKKILQIMGGLNRGGLETFVMNVYRSINRNEFQFDFLLTQITGGDYIEEAKSLGANIYTLPARNKGYEAYNHALDVFFMEHHDYAAIHEHISSLTSIAPAYYAKKYGIPVRIFHAHSSSVQKSLRYHWLHTILHYINKTRVHCLATCYLGCSDKALDWMYKYTGIRSKAIKISNGIDSQQYAYDEKVRTEVRQEFNLETNDFIVGHVGRFIPLKNQTFLVDILGSLRKINTNTKLMLVGEGDTKEDVMKKAKDVGLADAVIFTGVRPDVSRLMQAMDVFVMPSWFEGLPVSLVEAQAAGLPIIASSTISHDSDITGTILFKSIDDASEDWAKCIIDWKNKCGRTANVAQLKKAGFDSRTAVYMLMKIYNGYDI